MPRYYREADGMEPRLTFRLVNGYEMTVLLPIGQEWVDQLQELIKARPEVVSARIHLWNGELLLDLHDIPRSPHTVKHMREDDT